MREVTILEDESGGKRHKEKIHKQRGRRREAQELNREWSRTLRQSVWGDQKNDGCVCGQRLTKVSDLPRVMKMGL